MSEEFLRPICHGFGQPAPRRHRRFPPTTQANPLSTSVVIDTNTGAAPTVFTAPDGTLVEDEEFPR